VDKEPASSGRSACVTSHTWNFKQPDLLGSRTVFQLRKISVARGAWEVVGRAKVERGMRW